jgi:hypothetical protein
MFLPLQDSNVKGYAEAKDSVCGVVCVCIDALPHRPKQVLPSILQRTFTYICATACDYDSKDHHNNEDADLKHHD